MAKVNAKLAQFDGYCGKIARTFARKAGLSVRFEGLGAKTDGKTIWLPANSEEIAKTDKGRRIIDGTLDHEWLHLHFDDLDKQAGRQTTMSRASASTDPRYRLLLNIFDDVRIEACAPYEGVRQNLSEMNVDVINELRHEPQTREENFINFGKAIILSARGKDINYFHPGVCARVDSIKDIVAKSIHAKTSDDVHALSIEVLKQLKDDEEQQKQQQGESQSGNGNSGGDEGEQKSEGDDGKQGSESDGEQQGGEQEQGEGEGEGQGSGNGEQDDTNEAQDGTQDPGFNDKEQGQSFESDDSGDSGDDGSSNSDNSDSDENSDSGTDNESDDTLDDSSDDDMQGGGSDEDNSGETGDGKFTAPNQPNERTNDGDNPEGANPDFGAKENFTDDVTKDATEENLTEQAVSTQHVNRRHLSDPRVLRKDHVETLRKANEDTYKRFKTSLKGAGGALKNKLVTVLLAKRTSYTQGDKDSGRLDNRALHTVKTGNARVFSQRVEGDSTNVAVSLLVDCSYSMNGARLSMAAKAAMIFGEALSALGVPFNIWGFNTHNKHAVSHTRESAYNRFAPYKFIHVKDFHERWIAVARRVPSLAHAADGCNDDGGALRFVTRKLLEQDADRHILVVLSDGRPNAEVLNYDLMQNDLNRAIQEITTVGVEVIGLGIQSQHVREYYPHCSVIDSLERLPVEMMKQLKATMVAKTKIRSRQRT